MKIALILPLLLLAGCKPSSEPGQVFAKVNGQEIAVHQYNHVLKLTGQATPTDDMRRELANKLVDRELIVQEALSKKLDRQPDVMFELEEARRDVLARAYARQVGDRQALVAAPAAGEEAARYYSEHPDLFARRKVYRLREIQLRPDAQSAPAVKALVAESPPLPQLLAALQRDKISFSNQLIIRSAEQLPIEALPRLGAAPEGQIVLFQTPGGLVIYQVLQAQDAPLDWNEASPLIKDYFLRRQGKIAVDAETERLRKAAHIEYFGDITRLMPAGSPRG
ncbi:MAG: peptidyl-prolyl cis-trans isomerase, EpsD family [Pseudomonadota bacterium]|jgi:EpsD family peptidyl-prolyl cis-trans isomerase